METVSSGIRVAYGQLNARTAGDWISGGTVVVVASIVESLRRRRGLAMMDRIQPGRIILSGSIAVMGVSKIGV